MPGSRDHICGLLPLLLVAASFVVPSQAFGAGPFVPDDGQNTYTHFISDPYDHPFTLDISATQPAAGASSEELAKKLSNPVSDLISVPFQFNYDTGFNGPGDNHGYRTLLNIQPVVPVSISHDWNVIIRTIVPVIYQDDVVLDGASSQFGLGDTTQSFFLTQGARAGRGDLGHRPGLPLANRNQ